MGYLAEYRNNEMAKHLRYIVRVTYVHFRRAILPSLFAGAIFFFLIVIFASLFSVRQLDNKVNTFSTKRKIHEVPPFVKMPNVAEGAAKEPSPFMDVVKSQRFIELRKQKMRMTAVAMEEQGMKLSDEQQKLLDELTPAEKDRLVSHFHLVRLKHESQQLDQLRESGYVEPLPDGGERLKISRAIPMRFPASLKQIDPKDWPLNKKIFLNLTYYPWEFTEGECRKLYTTFANPGSLNPTALASFPSSGNSWLRYLIDCASGTFSGSLYEDSALMRKGLFGEGVKYDSGITLLQKTHGYTTGEAMHLSHFKRLNLNHMDELHHRGVMIIREPFKALISHRNLDMGGHTGYAPKTEFEGDGWKYFVTLKTKLWKEFYIDWLENSRPEDICVVFYEELKNHTREVLTRVLTFLDRPIDEDRLKCVLENEDMSFYRRPAKIQILKGPFKGELKDIIYEAIDELNYALVRYGHRPLPVSQYEYFDPLEAKISRKYRQKGLNKV